MSYWTGFSRTAVAAAVAVVAAAPVLAQNTTSGIAGRVTGSDGQPVAGATVTIVHVESGSTNTVTTDAQGRYAARGLRVGGPFTVSVTRGGQSEKRDGVFLALAETAALDLTLGAAQTITVTGRSGTDKFNSSSMGAGTSISSRDLQTYASISGNLQDFARTDPRISQTDKQRGEISALGQNVRYNSVTIDGVNINDTFGLESNNLPTLRQPIPLGALQSVQVNLSNYDVTQKGYTGANINAVTKSGTNTFNGAISYGWRSSDLVGPRYNRSSDTYAPVAPAFKEYSAGFTLSGPIIKDKLFFFANYEEFKSTRASPAFGPLGSSLTNVGITQDAIDQAISIARNTWNIDVGSQAIPQGLKLEVKDTLLKLDWNLSDSQRLNLRYGKTEQVEPIIAGFSTTGLSLSSWWYSQAKTIESTVGQWFADWTDNFSTELKVSQRKYEKVETSLSTTRLPSVSLRFSGALPAGTPSTVNSGNRSLAFGTENSRHLNVLSTDTSDIYVGGTWTAGSHEVKFGADYAKNEIYNAFLQNIFGNYLFGCEGSATVPVTYSFGTVTNCASLTPAQRDQATLENFQRGRPSSYTVQVPREGRAIGDGAAAWRYENTGLFVQDTWRYSRTLNFMFGARVDQMKVPSRPVFNAAAAAPRVKGSINGTTIVRDSGGFGLDNTVTLDGTELVQPRFGFNWKLGDEQRRMQVRGGLGLFQGAAANVWLSNPFSNTGATVTALSCGTYADCLAANATYNPNPDTQRLSAAAPAPAVDFLSTQLEQPAVWKANLAFESELPELPVVGRLVAGAEWVHTKTKAAVYYKQVNLGDPTAFGTDGRPLFYTPQVYAQACWTGSNFSCTGGRIRALSNPNFYNANSLQGVLLADKTTKGGGDAITLSLTSPAGPSGFNWSVGYTRTSSKEVSPLTSSTSNSNWLNRSIFDPNEDEVQNSNYLVRDRVNASAGWSLALVDNYRTSVGLFYEGRRGKPYSWTYLNDLNGDGVSGNDLMYVPSGPGSGQVTFRGGAAEEALFWQIVEGNKGLRDAKGGLVGRNASFAPWVNNFDLRVSQEVPGFTSKQKGVLTLDILNVGNLLSRKWGRIEDVDFPSRRSFVNFNGLDAQGRYIYSLGTLAPLPVRNSANESQWAAQVSLRYEF